MAINAAFGTGYSSGSNSQRRQVKQLGNTRRQIGRLQQLTRHATVLEYSQNQRRLN
jgi:hypothetical protein